MAETPSILEKELFEPKAEYVWASAAAAVFMLYNVLNEPSGAVSAVKIFATAAVLLLVVQWVGMRTFVVNFIPAAVATPLMLYAVVGIVFATELPRMGDFVIAIMISVSMPVIPFFTLYYILSTWVMPVKKAATN